MAIFWLALYVFVNLTSILWLGSLAITTVTGMDQTLAMVAIAAFSLLYQLYGGLKAVAFTDIIQVTLLILGGLVISFITLSEVGGEAGFIGGFARLMTELPDKFDMILAPDNPFYKDLPGISVLVGGMWIANPRIPAGSRFIIVGYAWSGRSSCGASSTAAIPGSTTMNGTSSFRNAAKTIPFCASGRLLAASARWMMY